MNYCRIEDKETQKGGRKHQRFQFKKNKNWGRKKKKKVKIMLEIKRKKCNSTVLNEAIF